MTEYRQIKGNTYEEFVFDSLLNEYDNVYFFKDTPESVISKTKLYKNYDMYLKYKNCDIGADLVAVKDEQVYFIQCKNFHNTISINDFCSFYFLVLEYELNGIVYYNGLLSERLTDLSQGKIKYNNLPYNNTLIDVNFIGNEKVKITPRDYQLEIYNEFKNKDKGIIALPCGMGKTYCSWLLGKDYDNIIILSPTRNLSDSNLVQLYNYSENTYNPVLISMDGTRDYKNIKSILKEKNIISSTYDSVDILNKVIKKLDNYIIFIDEYHNLSLNNLENKEDEINKLLVLNKKIIFMSATPLNNEKYKEILSENIYKYDWNKAIENKYICDFKIILPEDKTDTKIFDELLKNIEYKEEDIELIIKSYFILKGIKYYGNKKTILYASSIKEANEYSNIIKWLQKLININISSNIIDYKTSKLSRIEYLKKFKTSNKNQILINVQILNEGIDIPLCDSVYITKPNENITNLIQRMCRCNRILPNKKISYIYMWSNNKLITTINNYLKNIAKEIINKIEYFKINNVNNLLNNNINNTIIDTKNFNINYKNLNVDLLFNNKEITVVFDNNKKVWFNAVQICIILKYSTPRDILYKLVDKEFIKQLKNVVNNYKIYPNAQPNSLFINEYGLYLLLIRSKRNEAKQFFI